MKPLLILLNVALLALAALSADQARQKLISPYSP